MRSDPAGGVEAGNVVRCPHEEDCGACSLLGNPYADQLRRKRESLENELDRYRSLRRVRLLDTLPSPVVSGYRNRARMAVGISRDRRIRLGYFRGGTREITDAPDCGVLLPPLLRTTRQIRDFLRHTPEIPRELRHVDLRCGSDPERQHLILVFHAEEPLPFPVTVLRRACPAIDGVSINRNPRGGAQVLRGAIVPEWGEREIWVEVAGARLRVSPGSFFQVNLEILPAIHERMGGFLRGGKSLADLYAGVGTHGLVLASRFERVLFVEGTRSAVADLKATLRTHPHGRAEVVARPVERSLPQLREHAPDSVVLNPSRAGVHETVLAGLAGTPATRVAYLSCDPATLARDLDGLIGHGFELRSVQAIDMMPQTRQVEALALLVRSSRRNRGRRPR